MTGAGRQCVRFGRFSLTGVLGAALQVMLFALLMKCFHLPGVAATPIAVEMVLLNNYFWHERFTWRDRGCVGLRHRAIRLWRFHAANGLVSLAGNTVLTYCMVQKLKAPALPSAVAAIAVCAPINFLVADRWVFGATKRSVSAGIKGAALPPIL
ncbi:GtrA family protein [Candidatus Sulfopaludibacter sp. SbA6]|nr:GtrA family protein [Candidatus Sulfopaludibacter sp. SbA6]